MSNKTVPVGAEDNEIANFTAQRYPWRFSWANATKHHCGICWKKMRHSCIGTHTVTCKMYHSSLFIKGHERGCKDCRKSQELFEIRVRAIAEAAKELMLTPKGNGKTVEPTWRSNEAISKTLEAVSTTLEATRKTSDAISSTLKATTETSLAPQSPFQGSRKAKKEAKRLSKAMCHHGRAVTEAELATVRNSLAHILDGASEPNFDQNLAKENTSMLCASRLWTKSSIPEDEERRNHGAVLAAMNVSCRLALGEGWKICLLQTLNQLIAETISASTKELESKNSRKADLESTLSRRAADALEEHHESVRQGRDLDLNQEDPTAALAVPKQLEESRQISLLEMTSPESGGRHN